MVPDHSTNDNGVVWTGIVLAVFAILWSVEWAQIQPTQSLIGAIIAATVVYGLATTPVTVETGR